MGLVKFYCDNKSVGFYLFDWFFLPGRKTKYLFMSFTLKSNSCMHLCPRSPRSSQLRDERAQRRAGRGDCYAGMQLAIGGRGGTLQHQVVQGARRVLQIHPQRTAPYTSVSASRDRSWCKLAITYSYIFLIIIYALSQTKYIQ